AAETAEAVLTDGSGHVLEANDGDGDATGQLSAFNKVKTSKTSNEVIYAIEYDFSLGRGNNMIQCCLNTEATTWTDNTGTNAGGKVFKTSVVHNMYNIADEIYDSYADGDVRAKEKNFFFKNYTSQSGSTFTSSSLDNWFWFDETAMINSQGTSLNFPVFRFSEVYLIAAEAYLKQASPNTPKATEYVNKVRERAFTVAGTPAAGYTAFTTVTIDNVLTERLHEFPLEFKVWDDIRRTRLYPQAQSDKSLRWVDIATANTYNKRESKSFKDKQHLLIWPIPQVAIERNPALGQNPGY
ncbi:MAG: RagB/SusD family nutrient uptake outer membrane protein, partial [Prevotellaceae bacterium]|nr:RagB/SusD family nutrient uptake outer membrane protein [Prevotellaceae bacterium]